MMNLAKLESENIQLHKKQTDIVKLSHDVIHSFGNDTGNIQTEFPETMIINIDSDKMKQVFINLLHNALEYRVIDTSIKVELKEANNKWEWIISNQTNEIDGKDMSFLFDRFYRKDYSRVYKKDNHHLGVGLSIVKRIVEAHGGKVDVSIEKNIIAFTLILEK